MSVDNPAPKGHEDSVRGFNPGYGKPRGAALKVAVERRDPVLSPLSIRPRSCPAHRIWRPFSIPNPADAGCNSDLAQYSRTPSLRVAGFEDEDDDEDENEAPGEGASFYNTVPGVKTPG